MYTKSKTILPLLIEKLGHEKVLTGTALHERYNHIWRMDEPLNALAVVLPKTTADISDTLKFAINSNNQW